MKSFSTYIIVFLILCCPIFLKATHIVGGEMNYTCLGNDEYEITLTIFRDCFNGNPQAWFDDPGAIGVFNSDNELLQNIFVDLMNNDTLEPILSSECFVVPPNVCVHTTTYRTIVNLPPIIGGYQLAYQRCCRNETIVNIIDPLGSGATYGVTISEQALLECNSNPKFREWPPIYICVNEPISFDQSAVDMDGDSIVYKLCTPLLGATPDIPMPQPPNAPPYAPINWIDPPYNVDNMLNGSPGGEVLTIDPKTGLLTGLPNTLGQFVVGICVEEYRDNKLISTTRRDFQYNVGVCGRAVSAFFVPEIACDSFAIDFANESLGADDFEWYIEELDTILTDPFPTYTFPDTGLYTIRLIAEPESICADTSIRQINVQLNSLFPEFEYELLSCGDSLEIAVTDLSRDTIFEIEDWLWELLPYGITSRDPNPPPFVVGSSAVASLRLTVTAENGCQKTFREVFPVNLIEEQIEEDQITVCLGDSVQLNPTFDESYTYRWIPADGIENTSVPNPWVSPSSTTIYRVQISDDSGFCQVEREVTVFVPVPTQIILPEDFTTCTSDIELIAETNPNASVRWTLDPESNEFFAEGDTIVVTPFDTTNYYVVAEDGFGCTYLDSIQITGNGVNIEALEPPVFCLGDQFPIAVQNLDPNDQLTFSWTPLDQIVQFADTQNPIIKPTQAGAITFYVEAENQLGCTIIDSVIVNVIDTTELISDIQFVPCSGFDVQFESSNPNADFYNWHFGDPTNPGAIDTGTSVEYQYPGVGEYTIMITLSEDVPCPDTVFQTITLTEPEIEVAFDYAITNCSDTITIQFNDLSTNNQSAFVDRQWIFSNGDILNSENPILEITENTILDVTLVLTSSDGCVDFANQSIPIEFLDVELPDSLVICLNESVALNPDADEDLIYAWSPSEGLNDPTSPNPIANPSATTTYTATISDASGACTIERSVMVMVPPAITATIQNDTSICETDFLLSAYSNQAASYEWSIDAAFTNVFNMESTVTVEPEQPSMYYVRITDAFGCALIDSVEVGSYTIDVNIPNQITICTGDTLQIEVEEIGDQELVYDWTPSNIILSGGSTNSPTVILNEPQTLSVNISNEFGCTLEEQVQLDTFPNLLDLNVTADRDTLFQPGEVQLEATEDTDFSYLWNPADVLDANDIFNPLGTIDTTTTFTVRVRDGSGCSTEASIRVVVLDLACVEPFIFIPNGFTPNEDGVNDVFTVQGNAIDELYLAVYNRWGQKVFETESKTVGWDGTFEGELLGPDVYGYYLEVRCFGENKTFFKKGNVSLIR